MPRQAHHTQQKALSTLDLPFSVLQYRINSTYIQFYPTLWNSG